MKLCAPVGCVELSYQGKALAIGSDGSVEVDDVASVILTAHGFTPRVGNAGVTAAPNMAAAESCVEGISGLNRPALFAFLKSKGVSVSLPITNRELRVLAGRALGS